MSSTRPLVARGVDHAYGDRRVLSGVDLTVPPRARVGLIGENGVGKSTLLRIVAGVESPDAGSVERPPRTGILWQEAPVDADATIGELLDAYLAEVRAIERELQEAAAAIGGDPASADRYAAALDAAERADVWTLEARRGAVLDGLRLTALGLDCRIGEVSGGQRSRIALAGLLLARPDALVLDEPTNHLDDDAAAFLAAELRTWNGPVLFASHDRAFLDDVATELVDLDPARAGHPVRYGGGFTAYLAEKERECARWEQQYAAEAGEIARLSEVAATTARSIAPGRGPTDNDKFVHAFKGSRVQSAVSRRVRDAERRRDELAASRVEAPPPALRFAGVPSGRAAPRDDAEVLVAIDGVRIPGRLALPGPAGAGGRRGSGDGGDAASGRLAITARDRLLVTGPNGAGKSTLLAVLAGELDPPVGTVQRRSRLRVGLLRQDVALADPAEPALRVYERAVGHRRAEIAPLSGFALLPGEQLARPVGALSVGQRRRLALAIVLADPPDLLLLDEPSNHLSLSLAVELEDALRDYPGAVVVASHDRWLRRRWMGRSLRLGEPAGRG